MDMNVTVATVRLGIMCMDMIELGCLYTELDTSGDFFLAFHTVLHFSMPSLCACEWSSGRSH